MRIFLKAGVFSSVLALRPHVNDVLVSENGGFRKRRTRVYVWTGENGGFRKRPPEWRFSKTPSRVEVFENAVFPSTCGRVKTEVFESAELAFMCGRVKTKVFENDDAIGACDRLDYLILLDNAHAPHRALYHISSVFVFTCGRAKAIRIRYVWTRIFSKTEKKNYFR